MKYILMKHIALSSKLSCMFSIALALLFMSCSASKKTADTTETSSRQPPLQIVQAPQSPLLGGRNPIPRAVVYRTNGNYNDNVAIRINPADSAIIYYPAPSDITPQTAPLPLADGWLLDRQGGIGDGTVFLKWTYAQYHNLPATPTLAQLRAAIIPNARVTRIERLKISLQEAQADTAAVNHTLLQF